MNFLISFLMKMLKLIKVTFCFKRHFGVKYFQWNVFVKNGESQTFLSKFSVSNIYLEKEKGVLQSKWKLSVWSKPAFFKKCSISISSSKWGNWRKRKVVWGKGSWERGWNTESSGKSVDSWKAEVIWKGWDEEEPTTDTANQENIQSPSLS